MPEFKFGCIGAAVSSRKAGGEDKIVWLHPNDRIVRKKVIPTRIEMLAENRVWGRAEHIAEMIAFADVSAQQGAIWGYNDGEPELEEWGGYRTLYLQIRAIRSHRIVGKASTDPESVLKAGGESVKRSKSRSGRGGVPDAEDSVNLDDPALLQNPGVEKVRTWMQQLKHGVLPTWNRGLPGVWESFMTGRGTRYYKAARCGCAD